MFGTFDWSKIFDIKGTTTAAIAVGSAGIYFCAENQYFHLETIPLGYRAALAGAAIGGAALSAFRLLQWIIEKISAARAKSRERAAIKEAQEEVLAHLETLSHDEHAVLAWLVTGNQRSFVANIAGEKVATLKQKGLIQMGGGVHSQLEWPYTVPKFVWDELQGRRDAFISSLDGPYPWADDWY